MASRAKARRPRPLTVAVTGPDRRDRPGGRRGARALARGGRDPRHGAAPVRPRTSGAGRRSSTGAATCSTAARWPAWSRSADVVIHLAFMIMGGAQGEPPRQPRRLAQRVRGRRGRRASNGSSTPRRSPPTASTTDNPQPLTEDVPARGTAGALLLGPEGRGRGAARRRAARLAHRRPTCSGPASSPGPHAPLLIDSLPYTQISERLPGPGAEPARRRADPAAGAARPRRALPARPPRRRRHRDARGGARPRQAGRLQPRRRRAS